MTWDDDFDKRREREARRLHSLESGPEVEVLKRPVISAIVEIGRLTVEADRVRDGPLVTHLHVWQRRVDSEALGQPVLDVPDQGVSVGRLFRQLGKLRSIGKPLAGSAVLATREDGLIGQADRAVTRRGNKGLGRSVCREAKKTATEDDEPRGGNSSC